LEALTIDGLNLAIEKDQQTLHLGMSIPLASGGNNETDDIDPQEPKKALVSTKLDHLSLASSAVDDLQGYIDLDNERSISMAEDGQIHVEQSGNIAIVDVVGRLKPTEEKTLSIEDLDIGWKGTTAISLSPDLQPVSMKMEGTLSL